MTYPSPGSTRLAAGVLLLIATAAGPAAAQHAKDGKDEKDRKPLVIKAQGSFMPGGTVIQRPGTFDPRRPVPDSGQTFHGDHAYVFYQIPVGARKLPLVMWHGGGQFGKTWESTPDGREGFQNIFLRRHWSVYVLDQPRRGRAGRSTDSITIRPVANEQAIFATFRLGIWPDYFPGVQFPRDSNSLAQYFRQQTPNTGPGDTAVVVAAVSALFDTVGPAVLITHSASGGPGWQTRMRNDNVKAIVSYEPVVFAFPEGELPEPVVTEHGTTLPFPVSLAEFQKLTQIPIQIVFGDYIPDAPHPVPGIDLWYRAATMAERFRDAVNRHGGNASILYLPDVGLHGNTHFPFSDLNNIEVADLLSQWLREHGLDQRRKKGHGGH